MKLVRQFGVEHLFDEVIAVQYLGLGLPCPCLASLVEERVEGGQVRPVGLLLAPVQTVRGFTVCQVTQVFLFKLNIKEVLISQSGYKLPTAYLDKNVVMK